MKMSMVGQTSSACGRHLLSRFHTEPSVVDGQTPFHGTEVVQNTQTLHEYSGTKRTKGNLAICSLQVAGVHPIYILHFLKI